MNVLIILGHPNNNSFNHAIASNCIQQLEINRHSVMFHDLYAEKFDPILYSMNEISSNNKLIIQHCSDLKSCDAIIVIHPNWWGQPPAIVKGWIDTILLPDIAYKFVVNKTEDTVPIGILKAKLALIITTSNSPENSENDILDKIWKDNVFKTCGVNEVQRINFGMLRKSDRLQRVNWLENVKQRINLLFPAQKNV